MTLINPYELPIPAEGRSPICQLRRTLEPFIAEHMEGFAEALEGRRAKDPAKRMQAHTMLRIAAAQANQAKFVAAHYATRARPLAFEAYPGDATLVGDMTEFVTQMIHWGLDVYPRLLAPNFVSVQPFTQPAGYVFNLHRIAPEDTDRRLDTLSTFDSGYGDRGTAGNPSEGTQVKHVAFTLEKTLVEVKYKALMHAFSHEVDVALRSQYGIDIAALGDVATADELAWEVDREIIEQLDIFSETNADGIVYFDETDGGNYDTLTPSEQQAYDQKFIRDTLSAVDIDMSNRIYVRPTWYLAGTNVAKLLARTPNAYAEDSQNRMFDQSITKGSIIQSGRLRTGQTVWHDPQLAADDMIAGYTDQMNPFYAGYIFSPFGLASLLTAAFQDPDVLLTKRARALAFAQVGRRPEQYRKIKLGTAPAS